MKREHNTKYPCLTGTMRRSECHMHFITRPNINIYFCIKIWLFRRQYAKKSHRSKNLLLPQIGTTYHRMPESCRNSHRNEFVGKIPNSVGHCLALSCIWIKSLEWPHATTSSTKSNNLYDFAAASIFFPISPHYPILNVNHTFPNHFRFVFRNSEIIAHRGDARRDVHATQITMSFNQREFEF